MIGKGKLLLLTAVVCAFLAGCGAPAQQESASADGASVRYENETYGFSLEIPQALYDRLLIMEDESLQAVRFGYAGETGDGIPVEGDFFRILCIPVEDGTEVDAFASSVTYLDTENEDYYFYFWRPVEPIMSTAFRDAYAAYEDQIVALAGTFSYGESAE